MRQFCFILTFILLLTSKTQSQCTSFCFTSGNSIFFGNTLDWETGEGLIVVNKRNVSKTALGFSNPAKWISKYGSITFTQWGREFPCRGMNEAGLVIGEMTLTETQYPESDDRSAVSLEQWIQYQLDNSTTVEDVIASDELIRIDKSAYKSHFFVADSMGNCVTMEWLNGKLVYHTGKSLPVKVITNTTYDSLLDFYSKKKPHPVDDYCTLARFYRVAELIENYNSSSNILALDYCWKIHESVTNPDRTKWNLLFDITNRRVYLKTDTASDIRYMDFSSFDFSCSTPVKILDVNANLSGDVHKQFIDYNYETNYRLIKMMAKLLVPVIGVVPDSSLKSTADYPETTECGN